MTIEVFIEARLAEDEAVARESSRPDWDVTPEGSVWDSSGWVADVAGDFGHHVARHDPARVLRQCAALRELLKVASDVDALYSIAAEDAADSIRGTIAAIWSEHPNYQPEWTTSEPA